MTPRTTSIDSMRTRFVTVQHDRPRRMQPSGRSVTGTQPAKNSHVGIAASRPRFAQILSIVYNRGLPMDLAAIQSALRERNIDAWLFYDHHHRDPIAYRVLGLAGKSDGHAALVLSDTGAGRARETGAQNRGRTPRFPARQQAPVFRMAGAVRQLEVDARTLSRHRHAIFAQQYCLHHFSGRWRHRRIAARAWERTWSAPPTWSRSSKPPGAKSKSRRTLPRATAWIQS